MLISEAVQEFLNDHHARGSRPKTMHWYRTTLTRLLTPYWGEDVDALTVFKVNKMLRLDDVSPSTVANYDRALRGFCNWLSGVGELKVNPFAGRKRPRESFKVRDVLTQDEIAALFRVASEDKRFRYRHRAMLFLFLECGLRASELARLEITDVDWVQSTVRINGKTGFGVLPLSRRAVQALRLYTSRERRSVGKWLFVYDGKPLNQNSLSHLVSRLGKRAGIERTIGTHLLRHTFATHYLRNGGDAFSLQRMMRHGSMSMTMRYVNFVNSDLKHKSELHSPLGGLTI